MKSQVWKTLAAIGLVAATSAVMAQTYPAKPITLVVPFAPGASADGIARVVAKELGRALGQTVVVDNKPGGGGVTALTSVSKAPADGYTLGLGATGAIAVNQHVPGAPPFNAEKQLAPVAKLANIPLVLVASPSSGLKSLPAALDKARKQELTYGTSGNYTSQHLAGELLVSMTKARLVPIPYRGSGPAVTDLLGGQLPLAVVDLTSAAPHIKSGSLVALGVTAAQRSRLAPEIPTIAEAGVPGYVAPAWMGLFAPVGTPPAVTSRLSQEIRSALAKPEVQTQIETLTAEPAYLDSSDFSSFIAQESKKWGSIVAALPPADKK